MSLTVCCSINIFFSNTVLIKLPFQTGINTLDVIGAADIVLFAKRT